MGGELFRRAKPWSAAEVGIVAAASSCIGVVPPAADTTPQVSVYSGAHGCHGGTVPWPCTVPAVYVVALFLNRSIPVSFTGRGEVYVLKN